MSRQEHHKIHRSGWLRAAVLGANDGIVSTASLIVGIAAADTTQGAILLAGTAGLVAGALSMAAGEYVSVSSQRDTEKADLRIEKDSLEQNREWELQELTTIYIERGLDPDLADKVANQLMDKDALAAHARDELGINTNSSAKPTQAAFSSAVSFFFGAILPLSVAWFVSRDAIVSSVFWSSLVFLFLLGATAAIAGGAGVVRAALRVSFWGAAAMLLTAGIGKLVGGVV